MGYSSTGPTLTHISLEEIARDSVSHNSLSRQETQTASHTHPNHHPNQQSINANKSQIFETTKRCYDIIVSSMLLIGLSPIIATTTVIIKLTSKGPAVLSQLRLTKNGKPFLMYKFRSMEINAETNTGAVWTAKKDTRVTKFGKFIRRTHIDELPQLINVIGGSMSLIGPRPERPEFVAELQKEFPNFKDRLLVKAGISGLAQVRTGYADNIYSYKAKLDLDREYIVKRSLLLDLKLTFKTILVVLNDIRTR